MAQIETWYNQDLKHPVSVHYLHGVVFSQDNMGNVVGVNVFDNGVPASLSGTVSGSVIRSDGATVAVSGSLSGNRASIAIPQAGYAVPGVISIIIKLTTGSVVTTLCAVVANVYQTQTGTVVDPGTIIPDISELIAEIEAAIASIPADYSDLWESVAPNFNPSKSGGYKKGEYVTYNGGLYRFINAHSGSWNSADVVSVNVGQEISKLNTDSETLFYDVDVLKDNKPNMYNKDRVVIGKNWTGAAASNRAIIKIPVEGDTKYSFVIPSNASIPQVAVVRLNGNTSLGSSTVSGGNASVITTESNCTHVIIQFEGNTTLSASHFNNYPVYVFPGENPIYTAKDDVAREVISSVVSTPGEVSLSALEVRGYYINVNGYIVQTSGTFAYTNPIPVNAGCKYTFIGSGTNQISGVTSCDMNGNNRKSVEMYPSTYGSQKEYAFVYTPSEDGYIILCYDYTLFASLSYEYSRPLSDVNSELTSAIKKTERTNLFDTSCIMWGMNWTRGSANNRATMFLRVIPGHNYTVESAKAVGYSGNITGLSVVEIEYTKSTGNAIASYAVGIPGKKLIYTSANTGVLCVQLEGTNAISSSDVTGMNVYVYESDESEIYKPNSKYNDFNTVREMIESGVDGGFVSCFDFRSIVSNPSPKYETQDAVGTIPYYDVNKSNEQYKCANGHNSTPFEYILNKLDQEEIDFTPTGGFVRIVVGKNKDDVFFVNHQLSDWTGTPGNAKYDRLEKTTDFVNFETVLRCSDLETGGGIVVPGMTYIKTHSIKQFADGSYIVAIRCHDIANDNDYMHFYRLSADMETITHCSYINFNGDTVSMVDEYGNAVYDWSIFVSGTKALVTTYGSRNPANDLGRVWYTEDCGQTWKQIFQTSNHLNAGQKPGVTVTQAHTHGVMIDPYSNRLFVLVGENNRNVFWSDKGWNTTDSDWNVIDICNQPFYNFQQFAQVVNGWPFPNCLVLGSDNNGAGGLYRLNKLKDGKYSRIEVAHEFLPNKCAGTTYCCAEIDQRDFNSPVLMCETREGAKLTEEENEVLNQYHLARIVATFDGVTFTEVWVDDTYGEHSVRIDGTETTRNFAYCTRGMNAYLLKNGDLIIKYSGRDYYYFGADPLYSVTGLSNVCCKVRRIKNAGRYLV